jgi:hydroxymethylglutaryl-CoA synthase
MKAGIVTYGAYVPSFRITAEEIADTWGENGAAISKGLNVKAKSVPAPDEDSITISVEATRNSLKRRDIDTSRIGAVFVGSESPPYAVKPSATVLAAAIGATPDMTAADLEFACKAGTAGMQAALGMVESDMVDLGLVVGADTSQGRPGDPLEYTASAGGAAYILGKEDPIATFNDIYSYTTDTPDFWRRDLQPYPSHGGRFTGRPAYFKHITATTKTVMDRMGTSPEDYRNAIFHQPNGKFPVRIAKTLGFSGDQIEKGLLVPHIGNTYSGSMMLGLTAVLDSSEPGDRILAVSYGSGAGSDAFNITVTDAIGSLREAPTTMELIEGGRMISYGVYAKFRRKIRM